MSFAVGGAALATFIAKTKMPQIMTEFEHGKVALGDQL